MKKERKMPKQVVYELRNGGYTCKYDVFFNSIDMNDTNIVVTRSQYDTSWNEPGTIEAVLTDDGNGVTVRMDDKEVRLDYAQVQLIRVILNAQDEANGKMRPSLYPTTLQKFTPFKG